MIKRKLVIKVGKTKPEKVTLSSDEAEELEHRAFMQGVSISALVHEAMALLLRKHQQPIPPKLSDHLEANRGEAPPPAPRRPKRELG